MIENILSLFVGEALAQAAAPAPGAPSPMQGLLMNAPIFLAFIAMIYFGMIRPQKQAQKKQAEFITNLKRGEEVVTDAGIVGVIRGISDRVINLEISEGTEIKILKGQVRGYFKEANQSA